LKAVEKNGAADELKYQWALRVDDSRSIENSGRLPK